ncbi:Hypothetical predicted protein [Pelobates cultripes]|uniref:Uncharacterized protein n=1 Tax=Pelobates cultripes TaxID=61616 RepID=A0AAD1R4U3_PELCU|nr:Hypothetical predicted protein [Pelobates cultripes]CAH2223529.1 Hypothetical predicted protein [Pelobates cultripes]
MFRLRRRRKRFDFAFHRWEKKNPEEERRHYVRTPADVMTYMTHQEADGN